MENTFANDSPVHHRFREGDWVQVVHWSNSYFGMVGRIVGISPDNIFVTIKVSVDQYLRQFPKHFLERAPDPHGEIRLALWVKDVAPFGVQQ